MDGSCFKATLIPLFHLSIFERNEDAADKSEPLFSSGSSSIAVSRDGALAKAPEEVSSLAGTLLRRTASTELSSSELLLICLLNNGRRNSTSLSFSICPGSEITLEGLRRRITL